MFAEKKERFLKLCRILFVLAIFGFLLAGLLRTLFFPKEVNSYESRFAYTVQPLTAESLQMRLTISMTCFFSALP